jgi:hypothetical protein
MGGWDRPFAQVAGVEISVASQKNSDFFQNSAEKQRQGRRKTATKIQDFAEKQRHLPQKPSLFFYNTIR